MKKLYDWNVKLTIQVQNNYKNIEIVCSVHTNIHKIKIQLAKRLRLLILDSTIDIYYHKSQPLKPTSTLLQNGIQKNAILKAVVIRMKENLHLDLQGTKKQPIIQDKNVDRFGLSILCACANQFCINYQEDIWINFGYSNFPILSIISSIKCQYCPYKSQFLRPNMMIKEVVVSKCVYRCSGTETNDFGIPIQKETQYKKCLRQKNIKDLLNKYKWNSGMILYVKHI